MAAHVPIGPSWAATFTGATHPVPLHWYHFASEAACTQVRGATDVPSVAESQNPYAVAQPAADARATH